MSTATVHRRKLATTGAVPSGASAAKPRSRSRRPCIIGGPRRTVRGRSQGAEQPTRAVRAASLHPRPAAAGNFVPDPVTLGLTERAEHPMLAPSLHAFRAYASNHPEFSELKARGLNDSITHVDFMVGTPDLNILGITHDGKEIPVFVDGNFAPEI